MNKFKFKKESPAPAVWQVWLAYVEFEGDDIGKRRPVLVTETSGSSCTIIEITSKPPSCASDIAITDLDIAGLGKASVIQVQKMRTVQKTSLKSYLGTLSYGDRNIVKNAIWRR